MKKFLQLKQCLLIVLFSISINLSAQVPFSPVPNSKLTINGELKIIANNIVGLDQALLEGSCFNGSGTLYQPNDDYNGTCSNNQRTFGYIDIDNDSTTFSSSSADFASANPGCAKIAYAGLYWSATYYVDRYPDFDDFAQYTDLPALDNRPDFRTLKFKPPGAASYINIPASNTQVLYNGYPNTPTNNNVDIGDFDGDGDTTEPAAAIDMPYACYTDVTSILQGLTNIDGTYTVANMRASTGLSPNNTNGISGGWVLVIAYEDPSLSTKFISTNNGFLNIQPGDPAKTFAYTDFMTVPAPLPVHARYSIAALEGDRPFTGDVFQVTDPNGNSIDVFTAPANPSGNFFDSSITVDGNYVASRNPASENTLGFDADIFDIPNPNNAVIGNNQTEVEFTTTSSGDAYSVFFNSFQIEVIDPKLSVQKRVLDINLADITGSNVAPGDELFYELTIENKGSEDLTNTTISAILPKEVDFVESNVTADTGINYSYDQIERKITLTIDNNVVERFDPALSFRYGATVLSDCSSFADQCSDQIASIATSSYRGITSGINISEQSSVEIDACGTEILGSTNVTIDITGCNQTTTTILCTGSLDLIAEAGYTTYEWIEISNPTTVLGTTQTLTVTQPGSYRVSKSGISNCQSILETFDVQVFNTVVNPIVDIVNDLDFNPSVNGNIKTCPITGDPLPEIFLCGTGTDILLDSGFTTATDILWQRLDPTACTSIPRDANCPTTDSVCEAEWVQVETGRTYTAAQAGEYRILATFEDNCTVPFYFNVFQNDFNPILLIDRNIICGIPGQLGVENSSLQYDYQLITPSGAVIAYQASSEFVGLEESGTYTLNARQNNGLTTACIFQTQIVLEEIEPRLTIQSEDPTCSTEFGALRINVDQGGVNYTYSITSTTGTFSDIVGPTASPDHIFTGLNPDTYQVEVSTYDGDCSFSQTVTINAPAPIVAEVTLAKELSCVPGNENAIVNISNITGGSGAYEWSFDVAGPFTPIVAVPFGIEVTTGGNYTVFLRNQGTLDCIVSSEVTVDPLSELTYTATVLSDIQCSGDATGEVGINVIDGVPPYQYSIFDATGAIINTSTSSNSDFVISNLVAGTYAIEIIDARQCSIISSSIILNEAPALNIDTAVTPVTNGSDGSIEVNVAGGSPPYTYSLNNGAPVTSNIFTGLTIGNYNIEAFDSNGCSIQADVTVNEETPITIVLNTANANILCYDQNTAAITATVAGGTPPYAITLEGTDYLGFPISLGPQSEALFDNLRAGSYEYIVNGAESRSFEITQPDELTIVIQTTEVTCNGDDNASIRVSSFGGTAPYIYSLFDSAGNPIFTFIEDSADGIIGEHTFDGLSPGDYSIQVEDTNGCPVVYNSTIISEPSPIMLDVVSVTPTTNGSDGIIEVAAAGGVAPYSFSIDGSVFATDPIFTNLTAGTYAVVVRDANGCQVENLVTVSENAPVEVQLELENAFILCFGDNTASVNSDVSGGSGTYTYTVRGIDYLGTAINRGPQSDAFFNDLSAGNYVYIVNDTAAIPFTIAQPEEVLINIDTADKSCGAGNLDGLIITTVTGGNPPYQYALLLSGSIIETIFTTDEQFIFSGLDAGFYSVEVQDINGCQQVVDVVLNEPTPISLELTVTPITTDSDGRIEINATGGVAPYTYELKEAQTNTIIASQATNIFTIGTPGDYIVSVIDSGNCAVEQFVNVESTTQNPILDYADEIIFCAITGQVYPTITIQDTDGEAIDLPFVGVASIVWQKFDDITCDITLENDCPTTDSSCSSDWFDLASTLNFLVNDPGQYRVVIEFETKSVDKTQIFYFKAENEIPDTADQDFIMFPNPASGVVQLNKEVKTIDVFDVMGKIVLQTTQNSYDVSSLRNGVYFVKVSTQDGKEIIKRLIRK